MRPSEINPVTRKPSTTVEGTTINKNEEISTLGKNLGPDLWVLGGVAPWNKAASTLWTSEPTFSRPTLFANLRRPYGKSYPGSRKGFQRMPQLYPSVISSPWRSGRAALTNIVSPKKTRAADGRHEWLTNEASKNNPDNSDVMALFTAKARAASACAFAARMAEGVGCRYNSSCCYV